MAKLVKLNAVAVPLPIDNLDTDQIMPKQFLRGVDKSGLAKGTFFNLRCYPDGTRRPDCVFNKPGYEKAGIIVSSPNFGCGSSREHAVWGLMQIGIRAVIAPSFGEIFYSNCFNNGLLAAKVSREDGEAILEAVSGGKPVSLTIDVASRTISDGSREWPFELSDRHREMLLEGLDMVGSTLKDLDKIQAFRRQHEAAFPWMAGLAGKAKERLEREG